MTLEIKDLEVNKLAHELMRYTGESISQAVANALRERLDSEKGKQGQPVTLSLKEELLRIGQECASQPILDKCTPEEILAF